MTKTGQYNFDPKWTPQKCECEFPVKNIFPFQMWCHECGKFIEETFDSGR